VSTELGLSGMESFEREVRLVAIHDYMWCQTVEFLYRFQNIESVVCICKSDMGGSCDALTQLRVRLQEKMEKEFLEKLKFNSLGRGESSFVPPTVEYLCWKDFRDRFPANTIEFVPLTSSCTSLNKSETNKS
jgi:hypothetical protein